MIKGPTGCGKSRLVEFMAGHLDVPIVKVACNEDTNSADLLGRFLIKGGETVWQDGPVTHAVRTGAILYLDEIAEAREDVVVAIHPLTDHRREVYLDKISEVVVAPSRFMFVASFNPGYQRGLKELKPSTRQRFVNISMSYLPLEKEANLLVQLTGVEFKFAKSMCLLAQNVRKMKEHNLKETLSTHLMVNSCRLIVDGMNPRQACHAAIAESLSDDGLVVDALKDMINLSL
ncbi:MAG: CbbQ/NirQ/NorQ/GpvN family protein [Bdellovibrionales bacterium]|nr:CbbQ/NirQ/NorQ/GpvN family protein [Bdellovibrionales bacterium]